MSSERQGGFAEFIKGLSPSERERKNATFLADRFDAIKPHLREIGGISIMNSAYRDSDNKFVISIDLSFDKSKEKEIRDELANAEIREIYHPSRELVKAMGIGFAMMTGMGNKLTSQLADTITVTIYEGKYIKESDLRRLTTLESPKPRKRTRVI